MTSTTQRVAIVTGASKGLGAAIARRLGTDGWTVVVDARDGVALASSAAISGAIAIAGDVTDPHHRRDLADAVGTFGRLDLLVNNAGDLGPSPLPALADYPLHALEQVYAAGVFAPLALTQLVLPLLRASAGAVVNISSDAGVEPYERWGGYGSAKAALDHLTAVVAIEEPAIRAYSFDPGDMRTDMHQRAFPGEDISDRPDPDTVVPAFMALLDRRPPGVRHRADEFREVSA